MELPAAEGVVGTLQPRLRVMPGGPPITPASTGPFGTAAPVTSHSVVRSVPRAWLVAGYTSAHDRYKEASQHPGSPDLLFIPLFEALNWAGALEENLRPHTDPLLWAVRFVRNQVLHQWADAVEGRNVPFPQVVRARGAGVGAVSGPIAPPVVWEWFWLERKDLPTPSRDPRGARRYDQRLAGKPVREALEELRGIF